MAVVLFIAHCGTLLLLIGFSSVELFRTGLGTFHANLHVPPPTEGNAGLLIFLGFASAMLGVTGFETSANFVEQQKPNVSSLKQVVLLSLLFVALIVWLLLEFI